MYGRVSSLIRHRRFPVNEAALSSIGPLLVELPDAILVGIVPFLTVADLRELARTNFVFHSLSNVDQIWALQCVAAWSDKPRMASRMPTWSPSGQLAPCPFPPSGARAIPWRISDEDVAAQPAATAVFGGRAAEKSMALSPERFVHLLRTWRGESHVAAASPAAAAVLPSQLDDATLSSPRGRRIDTSAWKRAFAFALGIHLELAFHVP